MTRSGPALLAVVVLLSAAPAPALATDPLLSGYGGPGNGEQVVLGSKLLGPPGGGSKGGSLRAAAPAATAPAPAVSTPRATAAPSAPASPKAASNPAAKHRGATTAKHRRATAPAATTPKARQLPAAAPAVVPYPSRASSAGGLPLSAGDLVVLLLAGLALAGTAFGLRRLGTAAGAGPEGSV
jgi:hypothetical protein